MNYLSFDQIYNIVESHVEVMYKSVHIMAGTTSGDETPDQLGEREHLQNQLAAEMMRQLYDNFEIKNKEIYEIWKNNDDSFPTDWNLAHDSFTYIVQEVEQMGEMSYELAIYPGHLSDIEQTDRREALALYDGYCCRKHGEQDAEWLERRFGKPFTCLQG